MPSRTITVRLPEDLLEWLDQCAEDDRVTRSQMLRRILISYKQNR